MTRQSLRLCRVALLGMALVSRVALAAGADDVAITGAWARATVPGQPVAAAYLDISSTQGAMLTGVRSDAAGELQMHSMRDDGGVMRMRELERLELPARHTVRLAPSGTHLMLLELKGPLRIGVSITLDFTLIDKAGRTRTVRSVVPVRAGPLP